MRTLLLAGGTLLWLVSCAAPPQEEAQNGGQGADVEVSAAEPRLQSDLLVSGEWLTSRVDDPGVVVLHVGSDRAEYDRSHIPGARFLPLSAIATERDGSANELPPVTHLDSVFESVGVSDGSRVVVYGAPLPAARAFFTLDYLGHGDRTALLDGGLQAWEAEGQPLSTEAPRVAKGHFTPRPREERVVEAAWIQAHLENPSVALLDARPVAQFTGAEAGGGVPRPGHIPGAGNLYWEEMLRTGEGPALRDEAALRAMFREAGIETGDTVVAYCRTGMQASFAYFVARYLGYDTRMYDASFMDWSRRSELPVER